MSKIEQDEVFQQGDDKKPVFNDYPSDKSKKSVKIIIAIAILIVVFTGAIVSGIFIGANTGINKDMPLMIEAYELIKKYYYKDINWKEFQELATANFAGSLDKFSGLAMKTNTSSATGIGISLKSNVYNEHRVSFIYPDAPVSKARTKVSYVFNDGTQKYEQVALENEVKIEVGDRIYSACNKGDANGQVRVENAASTNLRNILSDANFDTATIRVIKDNDFQTMYEFDVAKEVYASKLAYYYSAKEVDGENSKVAMIKLIEFDLNACKDFDDCIKAFKNDPNKPTKLILDLRDNGGGDAEVLGFIANYLLKNDKNSPLNIAKFEFNKGKGKVGHKFFSTRTTNPRDENVDPSGSYVNKYLGAEIAGFDCVVLCNENSASSSEALIGAMQFYNGTTIVGNKTYGKGVGQTVKEIGNGEYKLYITNGFYNIPKIGADGNVNWDTNIHGVGFTPSLENLISGIIEQNPAVISKDFYINRAKAILLK